MALILTTTAMIAPAIVNMPAAQAEVRSQVVVHKPGTPRDVPNTTITAVVNGNTTQNPFVAGDSYGAFAFITTSESTSTLTIAGKSWDTSRGTEVWMDGQGELHSSRALAQGHVIVRFRSASDSGLNVTLSYTDVAEEITAELQPAQGSTADEAIFEVPVSADTKKLEIQPELADTAIGTLRNFDARKWGEVWISDEFAEVRYSEAWADGFAVFHYNRPDNQYLINQGTGCANPAGCNAWGMHVWDGAANASEVSWSNPLPHEEVDEFGLVFRVPLVEGAENLSFLFHSGDTKDPGNGGAPVDQSLNLATTGGEVWFVSENSDETGKAVYAVPVIPSVDADLTVLRAIWMTPGVIAWPDTIRTTTNAERGIKAELLYSEDASIEVTEDPDTRRLTVSGDSERWSLTSGSSLPSSAVDKYPHLSAYRALNVPVEARDQIKEILTGQLAVLITDDSITPRNPDGDPVLVRLTGIQLAPVLDSIYGATAVNEELGINWNGNIPTISVWAPTAQEVSFLRYNNASGDSAAQNLDMDLDESTGVWSITGEPSWKNTYFEYEVIVYAHSKAKRVTNLITDPYSISLSMNSLRTQIFDPADPAYFPEGWDESRPDFTSMKDASIYELHIRDFSATDETVDAQERGKYLAFTDMTSDGMLHLKSLADAGLTHLHLLPTFDIASVDEDSSTWEEPGDLSGFAPDSEEQQQAVAEIANKDGFNWGYDPFHFNAPEGSYAVEVDGGARILEFREMIQGLSEVGLRNVLDVVYNHTSSSGQNGKSVFDKIVPGYYHRLLADGAVATSTCCQNTAIENIMMDKFTRESILSWVENFKIDGFRFDLMGHHPKANMVSIRADLDQLTVANDGIAGTSIILYGEGWNFGEVANNSRFVQATQGNMAGTGIAVFDDRMRDSAKGGGPFDADPGVQGFASGAWTNWNFNPINGNETIERLGSILEKTDLIKLGLTGMVRDFRFRGLDGFWATGASKTYNGSPAAYNINPTDMIAYVDKHDNEALFDWLVYKLPTAATKDQRVRYQVVANSITTLSQGVPFWQAGADLMRSKSLDKNSYNSGDWFNEIDWSKTDNGFGRGLPMKGDNGSRWEDAEVLLQLADDIKPTPAQIAASGLRFQEFLKIRYSSPLFRLGTGTAVKQRVKFTHASGKTPGILGMQILDGAKGVRGITDLDKSNRSAVVVFNMNKTSKTITIPRVEKRAILHPLLKSSSDNTAKAAKIKAVTQVVKGKKVKLWSITVPGLTTSVFFTR
jgi:pullulanase-type alpha-1,6-glucosidase